MLSTRRHGTSILTVKEVLENGFVAVSSSHIHPSPVQSYYVDFSSASKPDAWEVLMDLDNATKGSSLCVVKQSESLSNCVKTDLHSLTQSISDLSQATFDLFNWPCEHSSRAGSLMDIALQNTSTPCKKENHPKLQESLLSKSTELISDLSTFGKTPAPRWEISAIKDPLDTSLSLDVSAEELKLMGCPKLDSPTLETSVVIPLAWPGAFKRHPTLLHRSVTLETQLNDPDPIPVSASGSVMLLPWGTAGCEVPSWGPSVPQRSECVELPPIHAAAQQVKPSRPALSQRPLTPADRFTLSSRGDRHGQLLDAGGSDW
ncbi:uncharacterized protein LOC128974965 [Indicator indicator]|uniref:uncharacterized protein LOC128974965 n=1 Tax=Indicator indicator TaxID=1002788 RepID=UPI0023DF886B|nr:uncharacterized protein LOC128974965 [Indicator indicator]